MRKIIIALAGLMLVAGIGIAYAAKPPSWDAVSMYTLKRAHNFSPSEYFLLSGGGYKADYVYTIRFEGPVNFDRLRTSSSVSEGSGLYMWVNCGGRYFCLPERIVDLGIGTWMVSVWDGADKVAKLRMVIK